MLKWGVGFTSDNPFEERRRVKICDHKSVGAVIIGGESDGYAGPDGRILTLRRLTWPVGIACVAGHVDDHGDFVQAIVDEVEEESGLRLVSYEPIVVNQWYDAYCRRTPSGPRAGHLWNVYKVRATGTLRPEAGKTADLTWQTPLDLQLLASRTVRYADGEISDAEFEKGPGLEPVWVAHLAVANIIEVSDRDVKACLALARKPPVQ